MIYKQIIRPLLFCVEPETVHRWVTKGLKFSTAIPGVPYILKKQFGCSNPKLERIVFGLKFPNPVGLAAGFDKEATLIDALANFGFGFIEIGTVTPIGQPGNPKPRMFRLSQDEALINRMGFNNEGVEKAVLELKKRKSTVLVGGNIGKNKVTANETATKDYLICFEALFPVVDYFVVNVSSPNTPNLRALQEKGPLTELLYTLQQANEKKVARKPILLKIAPDLTDSQLDDIIQIVTETKIDGVIATNTTLDRSGLTSANSLYKEKVVGSGGLSGKPLLKRSAAVINYLKVKSNNSFPIIGVGGIHSPQDAIRLLEAGASLVQVYTGFIYEGPSIVRKINSTLVKERYEFKF